MKTISVQAFCNHYEVPRTFIDALCQYELIQLVEKDASEHILLDDIRRIEKMMRMHYDLKVNFEALDIIENLTENIRSLQEENQRLLNRLKFYE